MTKLLEKILALRGPDYRPFAIEIAADDIRVSVYGGANGFADPPTCETASHTELEPCLMEALELLEHARLLSPSREPYHRLPCHRCVFLLQVVFGDRQVVLQRRHLMRDVPRIDDQIEFSADAKPKIAFDVDAKPMTVNQVVWRTYEDEVHVHLSPRLSADFKRDLDPLYEAGWELRSERSLP
jgi:hypothetical protein